MKHIVIIFISLITFSACNVNKQVNEIKTLGDCKFSINSIDLIKVSGVDVKKILQNGEVDLSAMPNLALGFLSRNIPLHTEFVLDIANPTKKTAGINQFDYQIFINKQELTTGTIDQKVEVLAGQSTLVPLNFSFNIYKFLSNETIRNDIQDFIKAYGKDEKVNTLLTIKIKPSILIGNKLIKYPSFINIEKNLDSKLL